MTLKRILAIFTSLKLTVACLAMAMVLVFGGTLAQVHMGIHEAQKMYFNSLFVWWRPPHARWPIPIFPGGYLIGGVLFVNLIAAHLKRFKMGWRRSGIFLTHIGLLLLLAGGFLTSILQVESQMMIDEG